MVDYSKFDNIGDSSDEEPAKTDPVRRQAQPPTKQPTTAELEAMFAPSARHDNKQVATTGRSGRPLLEPGGLASLVQFVPDMPAGMSDMSALAEALQGKGPVPSGGQPGAGPAEETKPGEPKRMCVISEGRKKVHTTYPDGSEMVEEFDERSDVLLLRKSKKANNLGRQAEWVYEVGQAPPKHFDPSSDFMQASSGNPLFLRKDTPEVFQWRIRNLGYPDNVYSVTNDHAKQQIVVRTSNKKYFKRIDVPDLQRLGLKLKDELLSWKHQYDTLIISYSKPAEAVSEEAKTIQLAERQGMKM